MLGIATPESAWQSNFRDMIQVSIGGQSRAQWLSTVSSAVCHEQTHRAMAATRRSILFHRQHTSQTCLIQKQGGKTMDGEVVVEGRSLEVYRFSSRAR